jgi:hypothetical protein
VTDKQHRRWREAVNYRVVGVTCLTCPECESYEYEGDGVSIGSWRCTKYDIDGVATGYCDAHPEQIQQHETVSLKGGAPNYRVGICCVSCDKMKIYENNSYGGYGYACLAFDHSPYAYSYCDQHPTWIERNDE